MSVKAKMQQRRRGFVRRVATCWTVVRISWDTSSGVMLRPLENRAQSTAEPSKKTPGFVGELKRKTH